jgi:transposase
MEGLSDRQAVEAVHSRIDWKYTLGLDLDDPGFDYSVRSKFRARLIAGAVEMKGRAFPDGFSVTTWTVHICR